MANLSGPPRSLGIDKDDPRINCHRSLFEWLNRIDIHPFDLGKIDHQLREPEKVLNQCSNIQRFFSANPFEKV